MRTLKQIAERDSISVAAVSKSVRKQIDQHNLAVERDSRGRVSKVSVGQYDHNRGQFGDSAKRPLPVEVPDEGQIPDANLQASYDEAKRQDAWLTVERKQLQKEEELGKLVRTDKLRLAIQTAGRTIGAEISRLPNFADELALAVSKEGERGACTLLKRIASELGTTISDTLLAALVDVSENDAALEETDA